MTQAKTQQTVPEESKPYYQKIQHLLSHYEEGWDIFINAGRANDFDYPVIRKEGYENDPYLPDTWIGLIDRVCDIIATEEMGLDVYPRRIEIIRPDQMLDVMTTIGLPGSYRHWSFGKDRLMNEEKYNQDKHLAYELVINSVPSIAYCMETNPPFMQALVIAHACYGHNAVFKNNYLFQEFTNAESILQDVERMRDFVFECEETYGRQEVSDFLDFCHAMRFMDVPDTNRKKKLSPRQIEERAKERRMRRHEPTGKEESVFKSVRAAEHFETARIRRDKSGHPHQGEKNILGYMAKHFTHMEPWKRELMRMRSELSEYFKPQMMTKVVNEGFASYTHYKIMSKLFEIGLIDYGMHQEFINSHKGVLIQPSSVRELEHPQTGEMVQVLEPKSINPYTLGFNILMDVERICTEPTEEDKEWFPAIAGNGEPLETVKHIMESCSDETLVERFLSPQVMRDMKLFAVESSKDGGYVEITAIHDDDGFAKVRDILAQNYNLGENLPDVRFYDRQEMGDRCLILRHNSIDGQILDQNETQQVLKHIHRQTKFPVVVESVDDKGKVLQKISSPPNYDYKANANPVHENDNFDLDDLDLDLDGFDI